MNGCKHCGHAIEKNRLYKSWATLDGGMECEANMPKRDLSGGENRKLGLFGKHTP